MAGDQADVREIPKIRFVELPVAAMTALLAGDLAGGSAVAGVTLTGFFTGEHARRLWRRRIRQLAAAPADAPWIARAALAEPDGYAVGYAGFHGPPDHTGMVEIGYSVDPVHRRRGFATAMVRELLRRAAAHPDVTTVRATIGPQNAASLATIAGHGFVECGEQWDDEDGLEIIFEVPAGRVEGSGRSLS